MLSFIGLIIFNSSLCLQTFFIQEFGLLTPPEQILLSLSAIFVLGIGSQWIATKLKLPSILLLLATGIFVGPVLRVIIKGMSAESSVAKLLKPLTLNPDDLLGDLILPIVSLSVAIVLFEGSLSLRFADLKKIGRPLALLLSVGVLITWVLATIGAHWLLQFDLLESLLLGAILTVTGPTVIGPLLREIRPTGAVGPIARWEGIVVDPIGAVLAVLVFGAQAAVQNVDIGDAAWSGFVGFLTTMLVGVGIGVAAAGLLKEMLRRHLVSDHLETSFVLMLVVAVFTISNLIVHESGLVTVTVMGLILANQHQVKIGHIVEFKENLSVLLISSLFILLSARLELSNFSDLSWRGPAFVVFMILLVRPISVWVSTLGCGLSVAERVFLSWLAPRGIVAAAVASVFALELGDSDQFVSAVFMVIVGTVLVYGLTARKVALKLGLSVKNPQGILFAGAHAGARAIALSLKEHGIAVQMIDTNHHNIHSARMEGLNTFYANVLSDAAHQLNFGGIGRLIAMTPNDEVNTLAAHHFAEFFGRKEVYRLSRRKVDSERKDKSAEVLDGRVLFSMDATYAALDQRFEDGAIVKATPITPEFTWQDFQQAYGENSMPLFVLFADETLTVCSADFDTVISEGHTVFALVDPLKEVSDSVAVDAETEQA
ncbi:MAG: sodium:proton antiporter [Fuerstiella sp.]